MTWKAKILAATRGTQLGAIAICALGKKATRNPRFIGKASITSDGFIMCDFVDSSGQYRPGAMVGRVGDLECNAIGVATHCELSPADRLAWFAQVQEWIATDWRSKAGLLLK